MNFIVALCRLLVGSLFIVSGLIKANDPLGFSYKLHDYFAEDVLNLMFLDPYATALAVIICVVEIAVGIAVIFGNHSKLTSFTLMGMIVFFTFLTFYSAYFNKVTDCGCFGDALKLTPWQSFTKDVVLFVLILPIFWHRNKIESNTMWQDLTYVPASLILIAAFSLGVIGWWFPIWFALAVYAVIFFVKNFTKLPAMDWIVVSLASVISLVFSVYCIQNLPIKDFRPYAIGKNISEGMAIPEGAQPDVYESVLTYYNTKTQEEKKFSFDELVAQKISENPEWEWRATESVLVTKGYEPPIHDFSLTAEDGNDYTEDILAEEAMLLVLYYDITKSAAEPQQAINTLANHMNQNGFYAYALTASAYEQYESFRHEHQLALDFLTADQTMLKTVVRSNPGIVLLKKGTVIGKWHYNNMPSTAEIDALIKG